MKSFKYSLIASALALTSVGSIAQTYNVVDLGGVDNTRHSFSLGVNNNEGVVGVSNDHFNFPIDLTNIDVDALITPLAVARTNVPGSHPDVNLDEIRNGIITAANLDFLKFYLTEKIRRDSARYQKLGNQSGFVADATGTTELVLKDQIYDTLNGYSRSTRDLVNAVNDEGVSVAAAQAPFHKIDFTPEPTDDIPEPEANEIWIKDFVDVRGVVSKGDLRTEIISPETLHGGSSALTDISESNYVVGYAAVAISPVGQSLFETQCGTLTDAVGIQNCAWVVHNILTTDASDPRDFFEYRAFRWKLDENLAIIEDETLNLGLSFTPEDIHDRGYRSIATGVNELGHVVGYSEGFKNQSDEDNDRFIRNVATYHDGSNIRSFINQDDYRQSKAYDINDNGIVVGYASKIYNSLLTKQLFYYDSNTDTVTHPQGFFTSSASVGHAINNNGIIVGIAEVESNNTQFRREHGIMFDTNSGVMTDLNDLTTCDHPYRIVEAKDINDNGVIAANALLKVNKKDALGNDILDSNGSPEIEEVSRAVKLVPVTGGTVDDCETIENPTYERKGAGFGFAGLLLLSALIGFRRKVR